MSGLPRTVVDCVVAHTMAIVPAIDRLNGHARAGGSGRRAIYEYKTLAALTLALLGALAVRPVAATVKCACCGGTGRWSDWYDTRSADTEPCRACSSAGKVTLRFVESRAGEHVWHHPYPRPGMGILAAAWRAVSTDYERDVTILRLVDGTARAVIFESAGAWTPMRGGERLRGEEAAALLNPVEDWAIRKPPGLLSGGSSQWVRECACAEMRKYDLDLGQLGAACFVCGALPIKINLGHMRQGLQWSTPVCEAHYALRTELWPKGLPPASAFTPAIRAWFDNPMRRELTRPSAAPPPALPPAIAAAQPLMETIDDDDIPF
jgi:hypothetical protein